MSLNICEMVRETAQFEIGVVQKNWNPKWKKAWKNERCKMVEILVEPEQCYFCLLQNKPLIAKIGFDTENEP